MDTVLIVEQNTEFASVEIDVNSVLVNAPSGYNIVVQSPEIINITVSNLQGPQGPQGPPGSGSGVSGGSWWF